MKNQAKGHIHSTYDDSKTGSEKITIFPFVHVLEYVNTYLDMFGITAHLEPQKISPSPLAPFCIYRYYSTYVQYNIAGLSHSSLSCIQLTISNNNGTCISSIVLITTVVLNTDVTYCR